MSAHTFVVGSLADNDAHREPSRQLNQRYVCEPITAAKINIPIKTAIVPLHFLAGDLYAVSDGVFV
jgi:hypothetical protein